METFMAPFGDEQQTGRAIQTSSDANKQLYIDLLSKVNQICLVLSHSSPNF